MVKVKIIRKPKEASARTGSGLVTNATSVVMMTVKEAAHASEAYHALKADEAGHAQSADTALTSNEATHAQSADEAQHAQQADHAITADDAARAQEAGHALLADEAQHAETADEAVHAHTADTSINADRSVSGDYNPATQTGHSLANGRLLVHDLEVWGRMIAHELEIRRTHYSGGNRIASAAGSTIIRVEKVDSDGRVTDETPTAYRCYFKTDDGTTATMNLWKVDDQAFCQTTNIATGRYEGQGNRRYWRLVTGVGPDYVDLSTEDCEVGSDVPATDDIIVLRGNRTDTERQGFIEERTNGEGSPSLTFYAGVNEYNLRGRAVVSFSPERSFIHSDHFHVGTDPEAGGSATLADYIDERTHIETHIVADIYVSDGDTFYRPGQGYIATLEPMIYRDGQLATDRYHPSQIVWTRQSEDAAGDAAWNRAHADTHGVLDITEGDLAGRTSVVLTVYDEHGEEADAAAVDIG